MANKKHNWTWKFRQANEKNLTLLINFKKHLQFRDISEQTIFEYQKDVYGFMIWLQERDTKILDATTDMLIEYMDTLENSVARKTRILSVLNQFYKLNKKKKYCEKNLVEEYKKSNK